MSIDGSVEVVERPGGHAMTACVTVCGELGGAAARDAGTCVVMCMRPVFLPLSFSTGNTTKTSRLERAGSAGELDAARDGARL